MGRIIIVNGSPRAPKSNSKQYAALFKNYWQGEISEYDVTAKKHAEICGKLNAFDDLLLVFPLYTDGLPATLLQFLKELENTLFPITPVFMQSSIVVLWSRSRISRRWK